MTANTTGFIAVLVISVGAAVGVHMLVRRSLRNLLDELVSLPAATSFYLRVLLTGLILIALSAALGNSFDLKAGSALMEYVWRAASGVSSVLGQVCWFVVAYLIVVTVLIAVLRRRHDQ
jgi:preprotein translocase subunit SecG